MPALQGYSTTVEVTVGGVGEERDITVKFSYWPSARPSMTDDFEPARVEIHKVTACIAPLGRITRDMVEYDLMPLMSKGQLDALEEEILGNEY